jgi:uncharacterized integral membrane protein (TIGR00698 family)
MTIRKSLKAAFIPSSNTFLGLILIGALAFICYLIAALPWIAGIGISSLIIAIILGAILGNIWQHPATYTPGIQFAAKQLLRLAIILYGFRITFQEVVSVGLYALLIDITVVTLTIIVGYVIARIFLKLDRDLSLLISGGAAICGAAAVLAFEDVLKSEPYKASVAIGTVVVFGTLSMFLYPLLQHAGFFGFSDTQFGIFAGASIHEVAQALVAGSNISAAAGKTAVIVKMIRVLLLVPVLFVLTWLISRFQTANSQTRLTIPWFAIGFLLMTAFNSLHLLPTSFVNVIKQLDIILLTMAMGAIGIETKWHKIKNVGLKPLYLACVLFLWLMSSVFLMLQLPNVNV